MSDITVTLNFDYSVDTNFNSPTFPFTPNGVNALDVNNVDSMSDYFKTCGWFSIWGKELDGVDTTKLGGTAFSGNDESWLYLRKSVEWQPIGHGGTSVASSTDPVIKSIEAKATLKKGSNRPSSPIVISMVIDGTSFAFLLHKTTSPQTSQLLGSITDKSQFSMKNVHVPFPANATWITHPSYQKGRKVSTLALAYNNVNIKIDIQTSNQLAIGWMAVQNPAGGSIVAPLDAQMQITASPIAQNTGLLDDIRRSYPNTAIAKLLEWAESANYITFDPPMMSTRTYQNRYSSNKSYAPSAPFGDSIENTANAKAVDTFVKPEGFELPDLPIGVMWKANLRGVIILERGGDLVWAHEVFDLFQMVQDSAAMNRTLQVENNKRKHDEIVSMIENLDIQIERVRSLLTYQEEVGNSIALQSRIFGEV